MAFKQASPSASASPTSDPAALSASKKASDAHTQDEDVVHTELTLFSCREAYVYRIPPASTIGHRAELWDVDHWLQEVSLSVVSQQDDCWVRLFDKASGELFAECPLPQNQPLVTVVEPVVDSSRYYVLRIEDRESRRHAFIGIGFRERNQASDFNAALDDHLQYLRRKREADRMRQQYQAAAAAAAESGQTTDGIAAAAAAFGPARDLALKPGETMKVALPNRNQEGGVAAAPARFGSLAAKARMKGVSPTPVKMGAFGAPAAAASPSSDGASPPAPLLPPPPRASPAAAAAASASPSAASFKTPEQAACGDAAEGSDAAATPDAAAQEGFSSPADAVTPQPAAGQVEWGGGVRAEEAAGEWRRSLARQSFDGSTMAPSTGDASDARHARFSLFDDEQAEAPISCQAQPHAGCPALRASLPRDIDESDAASLAGLSLKAHTSGGSSLANSALSEMGEEETAAEEAAAGEHHVQSAEKQDDWGDFVT